LLKSEQVTSDGNGGFNAAYCFFQENFPPISTGGAGDIWVDLQNMAIFHFNSGWIQWAGNFVSVTHPFFKDYRLFWNAQKATLRWYLYSTFSRLSKRNPKATKAQAEHIAQVLALTDVSHAPKTSGKRKWHQDSDGSKPLLPTAVPTYDSNWKVDSCIRECRGIQFPTDAQTVTWWNGLETVLPFATAADEVSKCIVFRPFPHIWVKGRRYGSRQVYCQTRKGRNRMPSRGIGATGFGFKPPRTR
jgi:hypothetical protein